MVHKWRSEEAAILVGTNTALKDDPSLTTRLWKGKNPVRIVIDRDLKLPLSHKIFNEEAETLIINSSTNRIEKNIQFIKIEPENFLHEMLSSVLPVKSSKCVG